jgi:hypothetical protein
MQHMAACVQVVEKACNVGLPQHKPHLSVRDCVAECCVLVGSLGATRVLAASVQNQTKHGCHPDAPCCCFASWRDQKCCASFTTLLGRTLSGSLVCVCLSGWESQREQHVWRVALHCIVLCVLHRWLCRYTVHRPPRAAFRVMALTHI